MPVPTRLPGIRVARGPGSMAELAPRWAATVYGIIGYPIYMVKTTVYLLEDLKERLEEAARVSGDSEARIIRSAIEGWLESLLPRPVPHGGRSVLVIPILPPKSMRSSPKDLASNDHLRYEWADCRLRRRPDP